MPKIHVMRHKLQLDIEVDPTSYDSLDHAAGVVTSINAHVAGLDHATLKIMDSRLNRVSAPEPNTEFVDDGLDIPDNLRRTTEPEAAE